MKIFLFKTNINTEKQKGILKPRLSNVKGLIRWSVDFNDQDNTMQVEGHGINPDWIIDIVSSSGFDCEIKS